MKIVTLTHPNDSYKMRLNDVTEKYETDMPPTKVGKIGVSYPRKKQFTLQQLLNKGWTIKDQK